MSGRFDCSIGSEINSTQKLMLEDSTYRGGSESFQFFGVREHNLSAFSPKAQRTFRMAEMQDKDKKFNSIQNLPQNSYYLQDKALAPKAAMSKFGLDSSGSSSLTNLQGSKWSKVANKAKIMGKIAMKQRELLESNYGIKESTEDKKERVTKLRCILPSSLFMQYWYKLNIIFAFYLSFAYIYRVCILPLEFDFLFILEIVMQCYFLADTVLNFFLAYYEQDDLITDLKSIVIHYTLTYLIFDLFGCIPVNFITIILDPMPGDETHRIIRLLPALRIFKYMIKSVLYEGWKNVFFLAQQTPTIIRLVKMLSLTLYFVHFAACIFVLLSRVDNDNDTWLILNSMQDFPSTEVYIFAFYWSIQTVVTVGFGDVNLQTDLERLWALVLMYIGSLVYSFLISNLGDVIEDGAAYEASIKAKIHAFKKLAQETHLPRELVHKVKKFIESNHKHNTRNTVHEQNYISELPFTLKAQIMFNINAKVVKNVAFFKEKDIDFILRMAPILKSIELNSKETVFKEGEYPEDVFFLTAGVLHLKSRIGTPLYVVTEGEIFGEVEVLENIARLSTAQAQSRCSLFSIEKQTFLEILGDYPEVKEALINEAQDKKKRLQDLKKKNTDKRASGAGIVLGSRLGAKSVSTHDFMDGLFEKSTERFESLIAGYVERGVGKKEKMKYVQRLLSQRRPERVVERKISFVQKRRPSHFFAAMEKKDKLLRNINPNFALSGVNESMERSQLDTLRYSETNRESKQDDSPGTEEANRIKKQKEEIEKLYFQRADQLKGELRSTLEELRDNNDRMKNQNASYDKVAQLIKIVEEKQQRINKKLELYRKYRLSGSDFSKEDNTGSTGFL